MAQDPTKTRAPGGGGGFLGPSFVYSPKIAYDRHMVPTTCATTMLITVCGFGHMHSGWSVYTRVCVFGRPQDNPECHS